MDQNGPRQRLQTWRSTWPQHTFTAKAEATNMAQRLAAAHLALAEVVHVIHLSDDVTSGVQVRMSAAYVQALRAAEVVGSPCEPPVKFGP
eukprot:scaffold233005_cov19-Tisochrysis_lutea.AAC.1